MADKLRGGSTVGGNLIWHTGNTGQLATAMSGSTMDINGSSSSCTGNSSTATTLQSARTIGGVSFDGSANINLPGVNTAGNQSTTGNAATATNIAWSGVTSKPTTLSGYGITDSIKNFGTVTINPAGSNATCTTAQFVSWLTTLGAFTFTMSVMKCSWDYAGNNDITDTGFGALDLAGCIIETYTDGPQYIIRVTSPSTGTGAGGIHEYINHGTGFSPGWRRVYTSTLNGNITGNATTATTLQTARTINGVSFNGSANITINAVDSTARIASSEKGAVNGVATLDASGKVPAAQLPSYVDDVIEAATLPATGETGKIYVKTDDNTVWRWTGSAYVEISVGVGTADSAVKLATARTIALSGDVTGSVSFDGSANATITATVVDDSHNHIIGNVDGLQAALDGKVDDSQVLTNVPAGAVFTDTVYTLPTATSTIKGGVGLFSDTVQSIASNAVSATASRTYGIQLNSAGQAVVNVPWVDTNTTYAVATTSANGLMSSTDKTKLDGVATGANNYVLPVASTTVLGGVKAGTNITIDAGGVISSAASGGATGGGSDSIFMLNGTTVTTNYSIPVGQNAGTFGPISIATGVVVTIPTGSTWTII